MSQIDLLGDPIVAAKLVGKGRRGKGKQWGYIMPPGTGPAGETCGTCKHIFRPARYRKCELARGIWTGGFKTDVLARSPACTKWSYGDANE